MNDPHLEIVLVHHPVIPHKERDLRFVCLAVQEPQQSMAYAYEGAYLCAACGNILGFQGQTRITYRHEEGQLLMAFF